MMAARLLCVALALQACTHDTLNRTCPRECYDGPELTRFFGECRVGVPVCNEDAEVIACNGAVLPAAEVCDGLDNDCDGSTDDGLYWADPGELCPPLLGVCAGAYAHCLDGAVTCELPETYEADETRCDGLDNDCDGFTDEVTYPGQYCYTGPVGSELRAPCHPGALACVDGSIECVNEVVPTIEVCDGADNDCNGIVDDGDFNTAVDIVLGIDTSGSMSAEIAAVTWALSQHLQQSLSDARFRFAVVVIERPFRLAQNFDNVGTTIATLDALAGGNGVEPSIDTLAAVCSTANPLGLSWRPNAGRAYFGFTDEEPQSYTTPENTVADVAQACVATGVLVSHWHSTWPGFTPVCDATGGQCQVITNAPSRILLELGEALNSTCLVVF
jgi:hypothetical protein